LHERFADWLQTQAGERAAEYGEILAYHLEQSYRYLNELGPLDEHGRTLAERAAALYERAAGPALGRGDMAAARFLYERAVSLYEADDSRRTAILPELGATLREAGDFAAAEAAFAEAEQRGDRRVAAHAAIGRGLMLVNIGAKDERDNVRSVAEQTIPVLEELGDQLGLARAWKLLAYEAWMVGHAAVTRAAMEKAVEHARDAGHRAEEIDCLGLLAFVALHGPMPVSAAVRYCDELSVYGGLEPSLLNVRGTLLALGGSFDEGRALMRRSEALYEDLGFHVFALALHQNLGRLEVDAGDPGAAEAGVRVALDALLDLGERGYASTAAAVLAQAVYHQGRLDEAAELARQAIELADEDDLSTQAPALGVLGKVTARCGRHDEAEKLARKATALMESSDFLQMKGEAFEDLAEVLDLAGKPGEARAAREQALELFELKESVVAAERVRARLGATAPSPS
jgi:tetratricopeptide (TPR) repeat protein